MGRRESSEFASAVASILYLGCCQQPPVYSCCRFSTYSVSEGLHASCARSLHSRRCTDFPLFLRACDRAAVLCSTMCYLQIFFWASLVWEKCRSFGKMPRANRVQGIFLIVVAGPFAHI